MSRTLNSWRTEATQLADGCIRILGVVREAVGRDGAAILARRARALREAARDPLAAEAVLRGRTLVLAEMLRIVSPRVVTVSGRMIDRDRLTPDMIAMIDAVRDRVAALLDRHASVS